MPFDEPPSSCFIASDTDIVMGISISTFDQHMDVIPDATSAIDFHSMTQRRC